MPVADGFTWVDWILEASVWDILLSWPDMMIGCGIVFVGLGNLG